MSLTKEKATTIRKIIPGGSRASKNVVPKDLTDEAFNRFSQVIPGGKVPSDSEGTEYLHGLRTALQNPTHENTIQANITGTKEGQTVHYKYGQNTP